MANNRKKNKYRGANKSPFSIQKRTDARGHNYFIDKKGARRTAVDYSLQWGSNGRSSKTSFEKALKQTDKKTTLAEARGIVDGIQEIEKIEGTRAGDLRKKAEAEKDGVSYSRMWDLRGLVAAHSAWKFDILKPDGNYFKRVNSLTAMDIVDRFIYHTNKLLDELVKKGLIDSPIVEVATKLDFIKKRLTLDLKNIIGIDQQIWVKKMIKETFTLNS